MVSGIQKRLLLIVALVIVILCFSFYGFWQKNAIPLSTSSPNLPPENVVVESKPKSSEFVIYISGAVNKPGVFKDPAGSRAFEAIEIAGGLAPDANSGKINLAQVMKDGMHIHVPSTVVTTTAGKVPPNSSAPVQSGDKISINSASKADFDKLPGIGPTLADRIIEYRQANGAFSDIAELKKVPGIGESKFNKLKDQITI